MLFNDFVKLAEKKFGDIRLADLAREMDVSAQVINGWKLRDKVPYKYVKQLSDTAPMATKSIDQTFKSKIPEEDLNEKDNKSDIKELLSIIKNIYDSIANNLKIFISITILVITVTAINVFFIIDPEYTSKCKILPLPSDQASSLQGLATTFGVPSLAKGSAIDINSPILYPAILKSRKLSQEVLKIKFNSEKQGKKLPLYDILNINNQYKAVDYLISKINIETERNSTLIGISVTSSEPKLAKDIADVVIKKLNDLQRNYKVSRVSEKRKFIEERIQKISNDLKFAEIALREFREKNRNIFSSPALKLEESRLMRNEASYLEIYLTLNSELERSKIEEVEKGSMLAVIDAPEIPQARSSPARKKSLIISIIIGIILSTTTVIGLDLIKRYRIKRIGDILRYLNTL